MNKKNPNERNKELVSILLEHPFLHEGLTAVEGFNYLLGRCHHDRRQEKWRSSVRAFSFWLKKQGFEVERNSMVNKYYWRGQSQDYLSNQQLDKVSVTGDNA